MYHSRVKAVLACKTRRCKFAGGRRRYVTLHGCAWRINGGKVDLQVRCGRSASLRVESAAAAIVNFNRRAPWSKIHVSTRTASSTLIRPSARALLLRIETRINPRSGSRAPATCSTARFPARPPGTRSSSSRFREKEARTDFSPAVSRRDGAARSTHS